MRALILAVALLAVQPAPAARLCRDLKGLATPCVPPSGKAAQARHSADSAARPASPPPAATANATPHRTVVGRGKLCRDLKGLATPCGA